MRLRSPLVLAVAALALVAGGCARKAPRPNVLFVVVDTLRADRVGALGGGDLTPHLDALAAQSVVFDHAQSPRAKTTPAVASLMTGLYPHDHHVRDLTTPLEEDVPVLAEHLARSGWATGAIVGNYVLREELSGLARGFDLWVEDLPAQAGLPPDDVPFRDATSITDGALAALGLGAPSADGAGPTRAFAREGRPWFLWLHYMDPHGPYEPPAAYRRAPTGPRELVPPPPEPGTTFHEQWVATYNVPAEARGPEGVDATAVRALYDAEVRYVDAEIGRLLARLDEAGVLDDTLVVFVADHGESLGEHDYWFEHGRYAYEATCRVPLFVRLPRSLAAGVVPGLRHGDVSLVDVVPTLTELLGLAPLPAPFRGRSTVRGRSRSALLLADSDAPHPVFCEKVERAEKARAIQAKAARIGDWKLLRRYTHLLDDARGERQLMVLSEELYDLAHDPHEAVDLVRDEPAAAPIDALREALREFSAADEHFAELARLLQRRRDELGRDDPETLRALRALGY
ncbi:MAG: sulfatase [Planctomycetes bacterium]|nr:sulfatase [Planctomycetota bacterium]